MNVTCWCGKPSVTLVSTAKGPWSWVCGRCAVVFERLRNAMETEMDLSGTLERSIQDCREIGER